MAQITFRLPYDQENMKNNNRLVISLIHADHKPNSNVAPQTKDYEVIELLENNTQIFF